MKKGIIGILFICMVGAMYGCTEWKSSHDDGKGVIEQIREWTGTLGKKQLTTDADLCGTRTLEQEEDYYTGSYTAKVEQMTGRDVVFGGAGIEERTVICSGMIDRKSGDIKIRVRMNEEVVCVSPDENGYFEKEFSFASGGNYIMVDYEEFTGNIDLRCIEGKGEYEE